MTVNYAQVTNDKSIDIKMWGEDDHITEFDVASIYSVYENLDLLVDFAYAITDFDAGTAQNLDNVFKAAAIIQYNF